MSDLISRQAAIDAINRAVTKEAARWSVEELPSAQPTIEPRTKGEWIIEGTELNHRLRCSCCSSLAIWAPYAMSFIAPNFCPNCGADMRGEQDG